MTLAEILFLLLAAYLIIFVGIAWILGRKYLYTNPIEGKDDEGRKWVIEEHGKSESTSMTLAGFALAALVFVFTANQEQLESAVIELLVIFLSLAFVLEIISALCYKHLYARLYPYYGFVFQYGGLLTILMGFFIFLGDRYPTSEGIWGIYGGAILIFFILTGRELQLYVKQWRLSR
ncbi:hypothetical protein Ngar_c27740 [Candidatus Nitrososphaera gargensis Ga9.2]|uniref:Uncharacterized protein n=1 Tax=Nitrososphaera gargensis (strain Ga9.2) TaxID=1237085 RepID=K0IIF9_NITGG|nr:hypothetical protein [Candidatus Nitrososphaera gargensis]AFU59695.1 hypothetical protein Ngar_c27740 [Candidatus Nitrososphaera gargensis Ga9.2]